jgi:hypothetical protein
MTDIHHSKIILKLTLLVIAWPLGLVQASCNPFKGERQLKGVNLGEIAQEVLSKWEGPIKTKRDSLINN